MCLQIIFTSLPLLPQLSFNFFLLSSSHGSNPSSYHHHQLPCRSCRYLIFHKFYFTSKTEHILKPLQVEVHEIIFPTSHHSRETGSEQESCAIFTPAMQSVPSIFRTRCTLCLCYIFLYCSSKLMILDALERRFEGSSEY
jgi:hypothetical protein